MEIDYNSVHVAVNEQAAPSEPNRNSKRAFQILPNMKPEDVAPILDDYQRTYATAERPRIVTQYQGENPSNPSIPSNHACQTIDVPELDDVILFLLGNERRAFLEEKDWYAT